MKFLREARALWRTSVPPSGQAATVQGELLRAVEKLRDEAKRNGNVNWDEGHAILATFVRDTLVESTSFGPQAQSDIQRDINRILDFESPYTNDDLYDRLSDHVIEWCREHPEPVPHVRNPLLRR